MNLQECKDYIAKEEKYYSWSDLLKNHNVKFIESLFDRVSELHTNKKTEALQKEIERLSKQHIPFDAGWEAAKSYIEENQVTVISKSLEKGYQDKIQSLQADKDRLQKRVREGQEYWQIADEKCQSLQKEVERLKSDNERLNKICNHPFPKII
jgi:uncharacterized small protein (DUF1192 family)